MMRLTNLSLRTRLAVALVSVAVLTVGLATVVVNQSVDGVVADAARSRLQRSAQHFAEIAATVGRDDRAWSPRSRATLTSLAELDGLRIAIRSEGASFGANLTGATTATAPIVVEGRPIGSVEVALAGPGLLTPEEQHLRHRLDRLHLAAGAASVGVALVLAFLLAGTLSRPLRRIRAAAERLGRGELETQVESGGDPELRSVAGALNRLAETLRRQEEIRKQTVADLSHELRTPVNGLLTRIEAAQDGVLRTPENLASMHDEALRLTRLLDDLSRLADAERPGILLAKEVIDLRQVARTVAESFAPRFAAARIDLEVDGDSALVEGDGGRLEQIVSNLISNALRFTQPGGRVRIRTTTVEGEARLEVTDTGCGIAAGELPNIFTRFWRRDPSRSPATGGTGIGLAIVRELVRAHDGRIDVESVPAQGSRFRVTLSAASGTPSTPPSPQPAEHIRS